MVRPNNESEGNSSSQNRQGKRTLAVYETCKFELKQVLNQLFAVFKDSLKKADLALAEFPPAIRSRTLEPSLIQTCFAECLFKTFPGNAFYGKYKRIVLNIKGYLILFKKLDKYGFPMNIKTGNVQNILNQDQSTDLFADANTNDSPILYFGYQKSKAGVYENPQIVYIDDGHLVFNLTESNQLSIGFKNDGDVEVKQPEVMPKVKNKDQKKAN